MIPPKWSAKFLIVLLCWLLALPVSPVEISYLLAFSSGWNLLGNSLASALDVKKTFAAQTNVISVWKWNAAGSNWSMYAPSLDAGGTLAAYLASHGLAELTSINPGEGYWVNASSPGNLPAQFGSGFSLSNANLNAGWNLASTADNLAPSDFNKSLSSGTPPTGYVPVNFVTLWAWSNAESNWYFYAPSLEASGDLPAYIKSKGYLTFAQPLAAGTGFWVNRSQTAAVPVSGEQRTVVLLASFPSQPLLSAVTPQLLRATYFGADNSVDSFLRESSYGSTWATGDVFGPFLLDADYFNQPYATRDAAIRAASSSVDFSKYDRIVLVIPQSATGLESGGLGTIGKDSIALYPQGSVMASTTWLGDASAGSAADLLNSACHEMGHNFGLEHARAADYGSEAIGPVGMLPAAWDQLHDFGDSLSNMGRGGAHWAAPQKFALGWLKSAVDFSTVEQNGTFTLRPYEATSGMRALRVRRGTGNDAWLWLEYRQPTPGVFDATLPANATGGALVHYEDASWNDHQIHSNLLRMKPDSTTFFGNAALPAGSSWRDAYSNLSITLGADTSNGLQVTVSYAQPPGYTLTPSTINIAAGGGQATITVGASADYAWTASSSADWLSIASGSSGTGNGQIVVTAAAATTSSKRWARIAVGAATAVVTQDGAAGDLSTFPTAAAFSASGGNGEITVSTSTPDYSWNMTVSDSWIQSVFFSHWLDTGPGTLRYIVAPNTSGVARTGAIAVGNRQFTITQEAGSPQVAKLSWQRLPLGNAPISRLGMDMAYAGNGTAILFGGNWDGAPFSDTWRWDGSSWAQLSPAHSPGYRSGHAMAYDPSHGHIVLFGGYDPAISGDSASTWIWDGTDWSIRQPATSPSARSGHAMVYDPDTQRILLFGGDTNDAETWEWDGSNWSKFNVSSAPLPRIGAALAYDAARREVLLFGGASPVAATSFYNDTWAWDGVNWSQKTATSSPTARQDARMEYNSDIGQIVLVGGYGVKDASNTSWVADYREETWTWNGANWTQQFPDQSPPFSWTYGLISDPVHKSFIAFLGDDLHCADRGPHAYAMTTAAGAVLLSSYRNDVTVTGGSGSFDVNAAVPWVAVADSWITITAGASGSTNGSVSYSVAANTTASARRGKISVNDRVFVISQAAAY